MPEHKWLFSSRFRRNAFGWKSQIPIQRIKEALSEIRKVARKEPVRAAEGAVLFLEKLSPALLHVDGSSGAMGSAVNRAIEECVSILTRPVLACDVRQRWLERLWEALQNDDMPYIEYLGDFWGELCGTKELASFWSDKFIDVVKHIATSQEPGYGFFKGTTACFSALYFAERYEELLVLLESARFKWWGYRRWGVKALVAMRKPEEALRYAEDSKGLNAPMGAIACTCEEILLSIGLIDEAYDRYAFEANQCTTNLSTFRMITKKYPNKPAIDILHDLIASQPGSEGKWFAAAKAAGFYDLAIELATRSPTDPHTLIRAAKEFAMDNPNFAIASGLASLHWIMLGYGYEITGVDVLAAYLAVIEAAKVAGIEESQIKARLCNLISENQPNSQFIKEILSRYLELK